MFTKVEIFNSYENGVGVFSNTALSTSFGSIFYCSSDFLMQ